MKPEVQQIQKQLFALQDKSYQAFQSKLMPTVPAEKVIGVRIPVLRRLAKQLAGTPQAEAFLCSLPHEYYEENGLHAFLLENIRDYDTALAETENFCPASITGLPATASARRCLQSTGKNCWGLSAAGWAPAGSIPCAMP